MRYETHLSSQEFERLLQGRAEHGHSLRRHKPHEARTLLEGSIQALEAQVGWPQREQAELLARAYTYLANVHRASGDFNAARAAFEHAHDQMLIAEPAPETAGEISWMEGFLYLDLGDFTTGLSLLRAACTQLEELNEAKALEAKITLAVGYHQAGQTHSAIAMMQALIERYPASAYPPGAYLATLQSLAFGYAQTGQPEQAKTLLPKVRHLAEEEGNLLDLVRVDWAEAEVHKAAGHRTLAAAGFRDVAAKFMAAQIPVDAALATLSQAEMYLELGDTKAAAGLAEALVPIFQSKGIHREATVAGLMVVEDLRREAATLAQVQGLVERLQGRAAAG